MQPRPPTVAGADRELGATLLAMAEMCNEGVDAACGALSTEEDAKLAWLATQVDRHARRVACSGALGVLRAWAA